jgi:hypothetical protein
MLHHKFALALGAAIGVAGLTIFAAQAADATRVRGTVAQFEGSTLTVKTREGATDAIKLTDGFKISGVAKASLEDIKVGDFVGITSVPKDDGGEGALEVVIFPAALKGTGEGRRPWDLKPNSKMNNATVANAVTGVDGRTVTLSFKDGQEKKISIPTDTPIVTFASATPADLVPGAGVFVIAEKGADGGLTANRVVVGNHGIAPPM